MVGNAEQKPNPAAFVNHAARLYTYPHMEQCFLDADGNLKFKSEIVSFININKTILSFKIVEITFRLL